MYDFARKGFTIIAIVICVAFAVLIVLALS
jgi:hypothetical protein